jgi:hypothetical protein
MSDATAPSGNITFTCAKPGCSNSAILAESTYIDGCGQVCRVCDPEPEWLVKLFAEVEPPF